ncbi:MAG: hypothetical protein V3T70_02545 [Phycisphaerae bacterium]
MSPSDLRAGIGTVCARCDCRTRGNGGRTLWGAWRAALLSVSIVLGTTAAHGQPQPAADRHAAAFDCGFMTTEEMLAELYAGVARGEVPDPSTKLGINVAPRRAGGFQVRGGGVPTVTTSDIFPFEDSASVLITNFSDAQLIDLMADATNALLATHGDNFDFVGFFVNFVPDHQIGSAFYAGLENDVSGIGLSLANNRAAAGVNGANVEGWVMMWRESSWAANNTAMLVLGQEFEHRFAMFLAGLPGRPLQGDNSGCGRGAHWNWKVDGQGSGMEIREWVGSSPATLGGVCSAGFFFICFNTDVGNSPTGLGSVFSSSDLYLMGYVSPAEMDAGNSELRYMETSDCSSPYNGTISTFDSTDIVASNGARVPDSSLAQKDFRTGWVMLHLPGAPPTNPQLTNVANILNRWSETWQWSTLNRGTMDNTLCAGPNGNMNGDTGTDGEDIEIFVTALINGDMSPAVLCPGDFDGSGLIDPPDVPGMVSALLN